MRDPRAITRRNTPRSQQKIALRSDRTSGRYRSTDLRPGASHLAGLDPRGRLVGVVERIELGVLMSPIERPYEEPIRKPRILRET